MATHSLIAPRHAQVPLRLMVPDQAVPVFVTLRLQLSPTEVALSARRLDFGACPVSERRTRALTVTNLARLPQKFGLVGLPACLECTSPAPASGCSFPARPAS